MLLRVCVCDVVWCVVLHVKLCIFSCASLSCFLLKRLLPKRERVRERKHVHTLLVCVRVLMAAATITTKKRSRRIREDDERTAAFLLVPQIFKKLGTDDEILLFDGPDTNLSSLVENYRKRRPASDVELMEACRLPLLDETTKASLEYASKYGDEISKMALDYVRRLPAYDHLQHARLLDNFDLRALTLPGPYYPSSPVELQKNKYQVLGPSGSRCSTSSLGDVQLTRITDTTYHTEMELLLCSGYDDPHRVAMQRRTLDTMYTPAYKKIASVGDARKRIAGATSTYRVRRAALYNRPSCKKLFCTCDDFPEEKRHLFTRCRKEFLSPDSDVPECLVQNIADMPREFRVSREAVALGFVAVESKYPRDALQFHGLVHRMLPLRVEDLFGIVALLDRDALWADRSVVVLTPRIKYRRHEKVFQYQDETFRPDLRDLQDLQDRLLQEDRLLREEDRLLREEDRHPEKYRLLDDEVALVPEGGPGTLPFRLPPSLWIRSTKYELLLQRSRVFEYVAVSTSTTTSTTATCWRLSLCKEGRWELWNGDRFEARSVDATLDRIGLALVTPSDLPALGTFMNDFVDDSPPVEVSENDTATIPPFLRTERLLDLSPAAQIYFRYSEPTPSVFAGIRRKPPALPRLRSDVKTKASPVDVMSRMKRPETSKLPDVSIDAFRAEMVLWNQFFVPHLLLAVCRHRLEILHRHEDGLVFHSHQIEAMPNLQGGPTWVADAPLDFIFDHAVPLSISKGLHALEICRASRPHVHLEDPLVAILAPEQSFRGIQPVQERCRSTLIPDAKRATWAPRTDLSYMFINQ